MALLSNLLFCWYNIYMETKGKCTPLEVTTHILLSSQKLETFAKG